MSVLESLINDGNQIIMESDHALEIGYEPATEGFFRDDKNPDIKMEDADNKSFTAISYKHKGSTFIGTDWVNVYLSSWKKTTEPFAKSGKKFVTDCVKAICDGEKYVNQHRKEFIDAYNSNNKEVCDNIAQGMRNIFTTSIATIRQENQGGRVFAGPVTEMTDSLKNSLKPELVKYAKIYRETGIALIKKNIIDVRSKSTIKRLFNYKKYAAKYNVETYLDYELYLYCVDLHIMMDSAHFN